MAKKCRFCQGTGKQFKLLAGAAKPDGKCKWCKGTGVHQELAAHPKKKGYQGVLTDFLGTR